MIITTVDLASYLRDDSLAPKLGQVVDLTNSLILDEWATPVDPVPTRVQILGLTVAARAWAYDPSAAHLESVTRTLDDANRTERYRDGSGGAVFLTPAERAYLRDSGGVRSIRLVAPGETA